MLLALMSIFFLQCTKLCAYAQRDTMMAISGVLMTVSWITSRLGVYPSFVLYSIWVEYPQIIEMFPAYVVFNLLLSTLLILHVFWTYFLLKLIYLAVLKGSEVK